MRDIKSLPIFKENVSQVKNWRRSGMNSCKFFSVQVKAEDGNIYPMRFRQVVNCAGPWAGEVGKLAGIGIDSGSLKIPIPVEPR